jgi:hypothetical protein
LEVKVSEGILSKLYTKYSKRTVLFWYYFAARGLHENVKKLSLHWALGHDLSTRCRHSELNLLGLPKIRISFKFNTFLNSFGSHFEASISLACGISSCELKISGNALPIGNAFKKFRMNMFGIS